MSITNNTRLAGIKLTREKVLPNTYLLIEFKKKKTAIQVKKANRKKTRK
jgi:hypothetical protein